MNTIYSIPYSQVFARCTPIELIQTWNVKADDGMPRPSINRQSIDNVHLF